MSDEFWEAVRTVVRRRKTVKVMGAPAMPPLDTAQQAASDVRMRQAIADAGWAPFHFDRQVDGIAEPWRVYVLPQKSCRRTAAQFANWFSDIKPGNKMPAMLAACACVVLIYWIPQTAEDIADPDKLARNNEEHLAATAAYVQNLLLLLDASGFASYWSSGGVLRSAAAQERFGIAPNQRLLACVFVDFTGGDTHRPVEITGGGQRERRSPAERWYREIQLD